MLWIRKAFEDFFLTSHKKKKRKREKKDRKRFKRTILLLLNLPVREQLGDRKHAQNHSTRVWTSRSGEMPGNSQSHMINITHTPGAYILNMRTTLGSRRKNLSEFFRNGFQKKKFRLCLKPLVYKVTVLYYQGYFSRKLWEALTQAIHLDRWPSQPLNLSELSIEVGTDLLHLSRVIFPLNSFVFNSTNSEDLRTHRTSLAHL